MADAPDFEYVMINSAIVRTHQHAAAKKGADGGIHNRATGEPQALGFQANVDALKHPPTKVMRLQKMPEPADRRLVRHGLTPQINTDKPQHPLDTKRPTAGLPLWIKRLHQPA